MEVKNNKDITVIIPILSEQLLSTELETAVKSVEACREHYKDGDIKIITVLPKECDYDYPSYLVDNTNNTRIVVNDSKKTDYCSQVNFGVKHVDTEYFSILEFDDTYAPKWFKMFSEYYNTHEDVSVFLPINVVSNIKDNLHGFVNEIAWSSSFSSNIGEIDFDCLQDCASFNLTGGIFKTKDWCEYKPSIKVSFNYEYLLRITSKKQKVYVIPKEGYHHVLYKDGSLTEKYKQEISDQDVEKWFELAKMEYIYDNDRNKTIEILDKKETLK